MGAGVLLRDGGRGWTRRRFESKSRTSGGTRMKKASKSPGPPSLEPAMSRGFFRRLQPQSDFQSNLPALARSRLKMVGSGSVADDSDHGRGRLTAPLGKSPTWAGNAKPEPRGSLGAAPAFCRQIPMSPAQHPGSRVLVASRPRAATKTALPTFDLLSESIATNRGSPCGGRRWTRG